jgi:hypothetical protein
VGAESESLSSPLKRSCSRVRGESEWVAEREDVAEAEEVAVAVAVEEEGATFMVDRADGPRKAKCDSACNRNGRPVGGRLMARRQVSARVAASARCGKAAVDADEAAEGEADADTS